MQLERLQHRQNKAVRLVLHVASGARHSDTETAALAATLLSCTIQDPADIVQESTWFGPRYLSRPLNVRQRNRLRQSDAVLLYQPIANRGDGEQTFGVAAPRLWNALPSEICSVATLGAFKTALKTHMLKSHFD